MNFWRNFMFFALGMILGAGLVLQSRVPDSEVTQAWNLSECEKELEHMRLQLEGLRHAEIQTERLVSKPGSRGLGDADRSHSGTEHHLLLHGDSRGE